MALPFAITITFRPAAAWDAVRRKDPPWLSTLAGHVLPLALLPAGAWPIGQAWSGRLPFTFSGLGGSLLATVVLALASVLVFAAGLFVLSPAFGAPRHWGRAVAVAGYAATPVLLSGALLVMPVLVIASLAACVHSFALCYLGVQRLLGCPQADAAFFVAAATMFAVVASLLLGGLCSAAGLI